MERDAALALLRSQHDFPGIFEFRVVVRPPDVSGTVTAMVAGAGVDANLVEVEQVPSRTGRFLALRVRMDLPEAERVLDVYEVLRAMDGVLASL